MDLPGSQTQAGSHCQRAIPRMGHSGRPAPAHLLCSGGRGMLGTMTDYFTRTQEMGKDQIAKMNVIVRKKKNEDCRFPALSESRVLP